RIPISFTIGSNSPLAVFGVEDDGPCFLPGNGPKRIFAFAKSFTLKNEVFVRFERSRFVGAGSPYFSVWHQGSKNISSFLKWSIVKHPDIQVAHVVHYFILGAK